jgi:predicted Fe-Mo cluster-binding NifX family protein/ferredoxin
MKIAVTSTGLSLDNDVETRFGRCAYFLVIDPDTMEFEAIENPNIALGGGAGIQSAQLMSEKGVKSVLTGNCGPNAFSVFGQAGIQVIVGVSGNIRNAVEQFKAGRFNLADGPNVESHFGISSSQQPEQKLSAPANPGMGNSGIISGGSAMGYGMGRGSGRGRGLGGGCGMGRGGGMGRGMGRGMGKHTSLPRSTTSLSQLDQLKQRTQILQQQKKDIDKRISKSKSNRKAAAFVQTDKCTGCGICANICPNNAINIDKYAVINPRLCIACAVCVTQCPNGAIMIMQQTIGN